MSVTAVLLAMLKLSLIMCVGYFLYKAKMIDGHTKAQLTKILLYVTTPALIIHSFVENAGAEKREALPGLFLLSALLYVALFIVGIIITLVLRVKKSLSGLYVFMTVFSNVGFMGFPVVEALYGSEGVFYAAVFNCMFNIFVFTLGVLLVNYPAASGKASALSFKKLLNPGILCCFVAVIIFALDIPVPGVIMETLDMVGGITSPLAMMLVGASLAATPAKELFGDAKICAYSVIRQFGIPLLLWPGIKLLTGGGTLAAVMLILAAMPVANTAVLFATEYKRDERLAAKGVFFTTVISIAAIPLVIWICLR